MPRNSRSRRRRARRRRDADGNLSLIIIVVVLVLAMMTCVGIIYVHYFSIMAKPIDSVRLEEDAKKESNPEPRRVQLPRKIPVNTLQRKPVKHYVEGFREDLLQMCSQTLWHTLETTTIVLPEGRTFIFTGDIDDLWLRDSAAQVHPLFHVFNPTFDRIIAGLIRFHAFCIRHDPYANAFRIDDTYVFSPAQKKLGRHDYISTWNYELDSACYTVRMMYHYWKHSKDPQVLHEQATQDAVSIMVDLWISEQKHDDDAFPTGPLFDCKNCNRPYRYIELPHDGKGSPTNSSAGLTWTGFRPSDDACEFHYLIPANMFCVVVLGYVMELSETVWYNPELKAKARRLRDEIEEGIRQHGIVEHDTFGRIYAYEVDGLGHYNLMDDANVPSLLSIPYLEYPYDQQVYENTRRFILSTSNPYYFESAVVKGIGSPHTQARFPHNVWPMSLAVQGLTGNDDEAKDMAEQLVDLSVGTLYMHESMDVKNPGKYSRDWFCWADALFAELVLRVLGESQQHLCTRRESYKILEWRDPDKSLLV